MDLRLLLLLLLPPPLLLLLALLPPLLALLPLPLLPLPLPPLLLPLPPLLLLLMPLLLPLPPPLLPLPPPLLRKSQGGRKPGLHPRRTPTLATTSPWKSSTASSWHRSSRGQPTRPLPPPTNRPPARRRC